MLESERIADNDSRKTEDSEGVISSSSDRRKNILKARPSGERCHERSASSDVNADRMSETKNDQALDNNVKPIYSENDDENSLYETIDMINEMSPICRDEERESSDASSIVTIDSSDSEMSKMCTSEDDEEALTVPELANPAEENVLNSMYVERCYNYLDDKHSRENSKSLTDNSLKKYETQDLSSTVGECSKVYSHKKRKYAKPEDDTDENLSDSASSRIDDESYTDCSIDCSDTRSSRIGKCLKVYTHKRRRPLSEKKFSTIDDSMKEATSTCCTDCSPDCSETSSSMVAKCLKVYTHKRRKSLDDKKLSAIDGIVNSLKEPTSTCCIDLSEENSPNNPPVTLPSTLDMETSEYIWSLSAESIQYVVGCTINQSNKLISGKESSNFRDSLDVDEELENVVLTSNNDKSTRQMKELFSVDNGNYDIATRPVLRRSVRINQLENDDSINNNGSTATTGAQKGREKIVDSRRHDFRVNGINLSATKVKRKVNKDSDTGGISDENNVTTSQSLSLQKNKVNSRSLRSTSKLEGGKSRAKPRCAFPRNDRDEQKTKSNSKSKGEKTEKAESTDCDFLLPTRLNTIASVDRALWGDMSDVLENRENGVTLITDYSPSKEIPFAVGLLPLRAALERMQATLDHQPRKTRSSVAPFRQDLSGFRRKVTANCADSIAVTKKPINNSEHYADRAPNTVCHIQIRTSEKCAENHRTSSNEEIIAVGSTSDSNRR